MSSSSISHHDAESDANSEDSGDDYYGNGDENEDEDVLSVTASLIEDYVAMDRKISLRRPSTSSAVEFRPGYAVRPKGSMPELPRGLGVNTAICAVEPGMRSAPPVGRVFSCCEPGWDWSDDVGGVMMGNGREGLGVADAGREVEGVDSTPMGLSIATRKLLDEILYLAATLMSSLSSPSTEFTGSSRLLRTPSLSFPRNPAYFHTLARYRLLRNQSCKLSDRAAELSVGDRAVFYELLGEWREMFEEVVGEQVAFGKLVRRWCDAGM